MRKPLVWAVYLAQTALSLQKQYILVLTYDVYDDWKLTMFPRLCRMSCDSVTQSNLIAPRSSANLKHKAYFKNNDSREV